MSKEFPFRNTDHIPKYKVVVSKITNANGCRMLPARKWKVLSSVYMLHPYQLVTDSYLLVFDTDSEQEARAVSRYMCTKFVRYLIWLVLSGLNITKIRFMYVPRFHFMGGPIDFTSGNIDAQIYRYFNLTEYEIHNIESLIAPMHEYKEIP